MTTELHFEFSVGLNIQHDQLGREFEKLMASQEEFRLKTSDDPTPPDLIILELDEDRNKTFALIKSILTVYAATEIFLTSSHTDAQVLLEALRAGVKEFIPQPLKKEELGQAFHRFKERHKGRKPEPSKRGKLLNIMGSKGGVGTTTIAVNLAISLLESNENRSVVLVDLNPQFGDVALFLDIQPAHTLGDLAKNISRLDANFLMGILSKHSSGLYVLPSANTVEDVGLLTPEIASITLELLQRSFDYIVIDSGYSLNEVASTVVNISTMTFLVSTLTLHVLRNTKNILDAFAHVDHAKEKVNIIFNRYTDKIDVSLKDVEIFIEGRSLWLIPNDYITVTRAINNGKPISYISQNCDIIKSFKRLVSGIAPELYSQKNHFSLTKFLNLF